MPLFFALSGYFFKAVSSSSELFRIAKNKLIDLGIPYLVFSIVTFILQKIGSGSVRNETSFIRLLNIYKDPIGYLWFLYTLFFVFIYVGFVSIYIKNEKLVLIILLSGYLLASFGNFSPFFIQRTLVWAPMFYFGRFLKDKKVNINFLTWILLIIYLAHVPVFRILHPSLSSASQTNPQLWGIFSFIGIYLGFTFIPIISERLSRSSQLERLGTVTMVVYLVHAPVASVIRIMLIKFGLVNLIPQIVFGVLGSLLISLLVVYLSKKIKVIHFVFFPRKTYVKEE